MAHCRRCASAAPRPTICTVAHVPGAFEIPAAARQLAETGKFDAIVCIGCLLRGGTLHYEVIANEVARGVGQSAQETGVPHAFGVLTCDTLEQAIDRAGLKAGNKGFEAAMAAVEMASLRDRMPKKRRSGGRRLQAARKAWPPVKEPQVPRLRFAPLGMTIRRGLAPLGMTSRKRD